MYRTLVNNWKLIQLRNNIVPSAAKITVEKRKKLQYEISSHPFSHVPVQICNISNGDATFRYRASAKV